MPHGVKERRGAIATPVAAVTLDRDSSLSLFEQHLPQDLEDVHCVLPRGMRYALSARLGGYGRHNRLREGAAKIYDITVKPKGRKHMVKEILRYGESGEPQHGVTTPVPKVAFDDPVMDAIVDERHSREVFRGERLLKFNKFKHVPALVSQRLVPCWRGDERDDSTPAAQMRRVIEDKIEESRAKSDAVSVGEGASNNKSKVNLARKHGRKTSAIVVPTISMAMKRVDRALAPLCVGTSGSDWHITSVSEARELLHPQMPALENGGAGPASDALRELKLLADEESKALWLAGDVLPAGKAATLAAQQSSEIREASKFKLSLLSLQYEKKRDTFRKTPDRDAMKSFERFCSKHKAKASAEAAPRASSKQQPPHGQSNFAGVLSLGMAKQRTRRQTRASLELSSVLPLAGASGEQA